jgi:hypothetical protein
VTVDLPQRRAGNQRHRRRPEHLAASGELFVPAVYNALRLGTRSMVSRLPLGVDADVSPRVLIPMPALSARAFGKPSRMRWHANFSPTNGPRMIGGAAAGHSPRHLKASTLSVPGGSSPG